MLRENKNILKESETHLFGKKFRSHMIEIEKSRKKGNVLILNDSSRRDMGIMTDASEVSGSNIFIQ